MEPIPAASGDDLSSELAGMSKSELYDIMSQMRGLIETNKEQAREILIANPLLTRSLFQAQIMLGMVKPPKVMPNILSAASQPQAAEQAPPPIVPATQSLPVQAGMLDQTSFQPSLPVKEQHSSQPSLSIPASVPPLTFQAPSMPYPPPPQSKSFPNIQVPAMASHSSQTQNTSLPSQIQNTSLPSPGPAAQQYAMPSSHAPTAQLQQPLQIPGLYNQPLQPPLPQEPRPPAMQLFAQQLHSQMPHSLGFHPSVPQHLPQPFFHSGITPQYSFPQGQPPMPNQPPPQQLFQGGSYMGPDYSNQAGHSMQPERGAPWSHGPPETTAAGTQLPGPSTLFGGHMASVMAGQPPRPPPLTPEMENVLLQQVMSLTPEQISHLPPEQRHQVLQLQDMLR